VDEFMMRPFVLVVIRKSEGRSHKLGREQFVGNIDPTHEHAVFELP
jgi:hypothetical protein